MPEIKITDKEAFKKFVEDNNLEPFNVTAINKVLFELYQSKERQQEQIDEIAKIIPGIKLNQIEGWEIVESLFDKWNKE